LSSRKKNCFDAKFLTSFSKMSFVDFQSTQIRNSLAIK